VQRIAETVPGLLYVVELSNLSNVFANREVQYTWLFSKRSTGMGAEMVPSLVHPEDLERIAGNLQAIRICGGRGNP
jgi:hypothetical protein